MNRTKLYLTIERKEHKKNNSFHRWGKVLIVLLYCLLARENVFAVPAQITNLTAGKYSQIVLFWTAPDNGAGGCCESYLVKYSTAGDITNETEFINAATYYQGWVPQSPGTAEGKILTGFLPDTTYWFSIKSSSAGVWSVISDTGTNAAMASAFYLDWSSIDSTDTIRVFWGDYDNDGDLDQLACNVKAPNKVYRNDGPQGFPIVWESQESDETYGICWGDYDNDGDLDQLTANNTNQNNRVYRNDGGGLFPKVWDSLETENSLTAVWGDYDNDGDIDQLIANNNQANRIYRNEGNGNFQSVWICANAYGSVGCDWGDYDNDGDLDFLIGNNVQRNRIWRNDGNTLFAESWYSQISDMDATMRVDWGDYDNDGNLDHIAANSSDNIRLYKNLGAGSGFQRVWGTGVEEAYDVSWGDYDNDGDLDMLVASSGLQNHTYRNDGANSFTPDWIAPYAEFTWGCSFGDCDNDGDLDALFAMRWTKNKLFKSEYSTKKQNTKPSTPDNFTITVINGKLQLTWNKCSDLETIQNNGLYYEIRMATEPITDNLGKWIISPSTGAGASPFMGNYINGFHDISVPGKTGICFTPKIEDTTYYYQVRSIDTGLKYGDWSLQQLAYASVPSIPVLTMPLNGSTTNQLTVNFDWNDSISPSGVIGYELRMSTASDFSGTLISSLTVNSYCKITTVSEGIWYWTVRSSDTAGCYSSWASTYSVIIDTSPPDSVNNLSAVTGFNPGEIYLSWTSPGDDGIVGDITGGAYRVRYSTYVLAAPGFWTSSSANWNDIGNKYQIDWSTSTQALTSQSYQIKRLSGDATYYFSLWTRDEVPGSSDWDGNWSGISNGATIYMQHYFADSIKPKPPAGIKTSLKSNGMEIRWSAVSKNEDGTDLLDGRGYNVYRSDNLYDNWVKIGFVQDINEQYCIWIDTITDSKVYYYKLNTLDNLDNESIDSMIADSSQDLNISALSSDKQVIISIPQSINTVLFKAAQGDDVFIRIDKNIQPAETDALAEYELKAVKSLNDEKIPKFIFPEALAKLSFTYNSYTSGNNVSLFWFNGVEWLKIGAEKEGNALTFLSNRLGKYMIKTAQIVNEFTFTKVYPQIFSPNNDGRNDYVEFQFENPKNSVVTGNVFDLRNGLVSGLKKGNNNNSLIWDGKTSDGETASPGIYIYQLEISGSETKTVNGTVIVAK